ncbi:HNH endonuclease signature motif containing protein [Bradyrhizobium sp. LA7.1]|uniref:HNH endonuclease signature motif containing protein n=1 Tax=Bradyrhizobium sp. LA7.1 TaxID=3156324 RepID=UPI0033997AE9
MNSIGFHHVVPRVTGGLNEEDNCVALCTYTSAGSKDGCHYHAHTEGNYRRGTVAPPEMFKFSHGHDYASHKEWKKRMQIFPPG